jgi:biopolymer transport protein TolR
MSRLFARGRSRKALFNEINVTPLVDVVLVLLIVFMVVSPHLHRGFDVVLPEADTGRGAPDVVDAMIITVTHEGHVYVGPQRVARDRLIGEVRETLQARPGRPVLIQGDERARYGQVEELLHSVRAAGANGVDLATRPIEGSE